MNFPKHILFILFIITLTFSCKKEDNCIDGSGGTTSKTIVTPYFTDVKASGSISVIVEQGQTQSVVAIGHDNIVDRVETSVVSNELEIKLEDGCYNNFDLEIRVITPFIEEAVVAGSGSMQIMPMIANGDLVANLAGSGNLKLFAIEGMEQLNVTITGSGSVEVLSECPDLTDLTVITSGSGAYFGYGTWTNNATATVSGSGSCSIQVSDSLIANIYGSGNVRYKGAPYITSNITGSGSLIDDN